jgi:hypothetical protein
MSRALKWLVVFGVFGLAIAGLVVFAGGLVAEVVTGTSPDGFSSVMQLSLLGLCVSAAMFLLLFLLVGLPASRAVRVQAMPMRTG